jgi:hypothetical protein
MADRPYIVSGALAEPERTFGSIRAALGYAVERAITMKPDTGLVVRRRDGAWSATVMRRAPFGVAIRWSADLSLGGGRG